MSTVDPLTLWQNYSEKEQRIAEDILKKHGYRLAEKQPHIIGERYVMQAVTTTSGKKLVLVGKDTKTDRMVIIKTAHDASGIQEIEHERAAKKTLKEIYFGYAVFETPEELLYLKEGGRVFAVYEFIEQEKPFLTYTNEEQFYWALGAFKAQENTHATTYTHLKHIRNTFKTFTAENYKKHLREFVKTIREFSNGFEKLAEVEALFEKESAVVEQYCGFLTHVDFVPHNFRINHDTVYLLDFSSLRFGNKYEGWARFLNYMTLYNPTVTGWLVEYVEKNRPPEEALSLKLMRLYRLSELISFYIKTLEKADAQLHTLNTKRIHFWYEVLTATLNGTPLPDEILFGYRKARDLLRSEDEKRRQKEIS